MVERDEAEGMENQSGCTTDWQTYCKLRNHELNKKKKLHYETKKLQRMIVKIFGAP
jgi:hypothetical protein